MGKSLPSKQLKNFAKIISSNKIKNTQKQTKPTLTSHERVDELGQKMGDSGVTRVPLSMVVSNCVKRWFQATLKEAKNGEISMQMLVGQMYNSGYGVRKNHQKGRAWIARATKGRSSTWRASNKQPGFNASDSDSDDPKEARS
ncbi:hypothetical protein RND81_10G157500 [Saponaria officinalis]|uniref:Sel1-like protein n=1 Tax=Saponaria officinalis TaxID=3572 RepID=A0AAW1I501_SAPOF